MSLTAAAMRLLGFEGAPALGALLPRVQHVQLREGDLRVSYAGLITEAHDLDAFVRACVDAALELSGAQPGQPSTPYR